MREAFRGWDGQRPYVMEVPADDTKGGPMTVATTPAQVVSVDETHRVLVVTGTPSDEDGQDAASHASSGNLGAYWFTRRHGRWFVSARRDSLLWTGVSGHVGTVEPFDLGGGHRAVTVVGGSCWQGFCGDWLTVVEFGVDQARVIVDGLPLASDSTSAREGCDRLLDGAGGVPKEQLLQLGTETCFAVSGKWRLQPRVDSQRGDIAIDYTGHDLTQVAPGQALRVRTIHDTLVLRCDGATCKPISGRNPTHAF